MIKIVSIEQMREIERAADAAGVTYAQMMEQAGKSVADVVASVLGANPAGKRVLVLIGPGNNGGDGLVAARILRRELGIQVDAYLLRSRTDEDSNYVAAREAGVSIANAQDDQRWSVLKNQVTSADLIIDALLGTGARLPIEGDLAELLRTASQALNLTNEPQSHLTWPAKPIQLKNDRPVIIAVDCPSGLNADTGALDPATLNADITVTFAAAKFGHLIFPSAGAVGQLVIASIGTPASLVTNIHTELAAAPDIAEMLPKRPRDGHKGTFGRAVIAAGSANYTGAAYLSAASAYRIGAGLVTLAVPQPIYPILAAQLPEATWISLPHERGFLNPEAANLFFEAAGEFDALLIGPGIGRDRTTAGFIWGLLTGQPHEQQSNDQSASSRIATLVIDADGLNLLSEREVWWTYLPRHTVLTPHPGEMSRLSGLSIAAINENRFEVARQKAQEWGVILVLKGAFTIVASPDGKLIASPFATDALATAGTGDILAGCIVGLMAQGAAPFEAAVTATYLHGLAGTLAGEGGSRSVIASDVLITLPAAIAAIEHP